MDLKTTYNTIAQDWAKDHAGDTWWQAGTDEFLRFLKPGMSILDIGCGPGIKTDHMQKKGFDVLGTDFSESMIDVAKRKYPNSKFEVLDVYHLDQYPKTFDAVFAQAVLLHIPKSDIMGILKAIKTKINLDGFLYIAVKAVNESGIEEEVLTENDYDYSYERFFSYFTEEEIEGYIKELGMELIWEKSDFIGKTKWIQVVAKKAI